MLSNDENNFNAPGFRAYLQRLEWKRLLVWERESWEELKSCTGSPILLNIDELPMSDVLNDATVVAATAQDLTSSDAAISIYRYDLEDSKPINVDINNVWEDLPSYYIFEDIVAESSINIDENLIETLNRFIFITKAEKGSGHWLDYDELPYIAQIVIDELDLDSTSRDFSND
ncbi:MAG: hypothetical protein DRO90_03330 [Candidatus Altiarchaeales archaeon]|nr:MAG: hypothetical protein DRO90_03330 [Candidatus Altiarchaeales archaeon]